MPNAFNEGDAKRLLVDHHVPDAQCPHCKAMNDGALSLTGTSSPVPGDLSVCIKCASPLTFDTEFKLQVMSEEDISKLHPEERKNLTRAILLVTEALKERQGRSI